MVNISDILGYSFGRNLSKVILILAAVAISTYARTSEKIADFLNFELYITVTNLIALSLIIVAIMIKDDKINPPLIPRTDRMGTRFIFYGLLLLIATAISTIEFGLLDNFLDMTFLGFDWFAYKV